MTLEQLARERGVWFNDRTTSCTVKVAEQAGNATATLISRAEENSQCIIHIFGGEMTTASFAMYTFSLAVLVQALSLISFSSVADYGKSFRSFIFCHKLTRFRYLSQEVPSWIRVHWCHNLDALPPYCSKSLSLRSSSSDHRSHLPRILSCYS